MEIDKYMPTVCFGDIRKRYFLDDIETDDRYTDKMFKYSLLAVVDMLDNMDDNNTEQALFSGFLFSTALLCVEIHIPTSYKKAINYPTYRKMWKGAIEEEIRGLTENRTWV